MQSTRGRRKLAAANASADPAGSHAADPCAQPAYLSNETTPDAVFDQLTPEEYMDAAKFLVTTCC